jgi:DNA-binding CsgD family transcriptional regulator
MPGVVERAWGFVEAVRSTASPDQFADVVVHRLGELVPSDAIACNDVDQRDRRARSRGPLGASAVYRESLWLDGYPYSLDVVIASSAATGCAVLMGRSERDFTVRECDLLALLAPHLQAAYEHARLVGILTPRERAVLALVQRGLTNREIARSLGIAPGTVRAHLEHAFSKLGARTRTEAASLAR